MEVGREAELAVRLTLVILLDNDLSLQGVDICDGGAPARNLPTVHGGVRQGGLQLQVPVLCCVLLKLVLFSTIQLQVLVLCYVSVGIGLGVSVGALLEPVLYSTIHLQVRVLCNVGEGVGVGVGVILELVLVCF